MSEETVTIPVRGKNYRVYFYGIKSLAHSIDCIKCKRQYALWRVNVKRCTIIPLDETKTISEASNPDLFHEIIAEVNNQLVTAELDKMERNCGCHKCSYLKAMAA